MPNSPLSWEIESKKIWLKQLKAAPALDFSYFQHASKLVTHHSKRSETKGFQTSFLVSDPLFDPLTVLGLSIDSAPHISIHLAGAQLCCLLRAFHPAGTGAAAAESEAGLDLREPL